MRSIPGMTVINPADDTEARLAVRAAAAMDGPVYLRFGRLAVPVVTGGDFAIGKGVQLVDGKDVTIIATGLLVAEALIAAEELKNEGISARVINMATIKPIDRDIIVKAANETGAIVTAEEHNILGGLGSAVAEVVCETVPVPVVPGRRQRHLRQIGPRRRAAEAVWPVRVQYRRPRQRCPDPQKVNSASDANVHRRQAVYV